MSCLLRGPSATTSKVRPLDRPLDVTSTSPPSDVHPSRTPSSSTSSKTRSHDRRRRALERARSQSRSSSRASRRFDELTATTPAATASAVRSSATVDRRPARTHHTASRCTSREQRSATRFARMVFPMLPGPSLASVIHTGRARSRQRTARCSCCWRPTHSESRIEPRLVSADGVIVVAERLSREGRLGIACRRLARCPARCWACPVRAPWRRRPRPPRARWPGRHPEQHGRSAHIDTRRGGCRKEVNPKNVAMFAPMPRAVDELLAVGHV